MPAILDRDRFMFVNIGVIVTWQVRMRMTVRMGMPVKMGVRNIAFRMPVAHTRPQQHTATHYGEHRNDKPILTAGKPQLAEILGRESDDQCSLKFCRSRFAPASRPKIPIHAEHRGRTPPSSLQGTPHEPYRLTP